jgi:glycosyltransferase involved in cell wall biosynthesis
MVIWLISLFDPTPFDNVAMGRYIGVAQAAVARGHTVTHFTSTFRHALKKHRFTNSKTINIENNYTVKYIHSMGYKQNIHPKRFFAHWVFAKKLIDAIKVEPIPDIIFISIPPLSIASEVTSWAKKRNIPVVVDIIDPWPDSFIKDVPVSLKPLAKVVLTPFYEKLKKLLQESSALSAISKGYIDWGTKYLGSVKKPSEYFYPAVDFSMIQEKSKLLSQEVIRNNDKLRLIYAGSLASSYDILSICKAAEIINSKYPGKTEFVIAGTGPNEALVRQYQSQLSNLIYLGWVNRDELIQQYYLSDLGFIQHMNSLTQTVTYKLFSYLGAGLPVLNSLQSEMVNIVSDYEVGLNNKEGDYQTLAANIEFFLQNPGKLATYKANALQLTALKGDTKIVYDNLVDYLERIAQLHSAN